MSDVLRVGFIGAGLIGTFHSKMLRAAGGLIERAGVYDPDPQRAQQFADASGHTVCQSEEAVLDGCDAVYICTWTSEHARLVEAAAQRHLAVFCEKPLATNLATAQAMAAAVDRAGVTNQVGLILRRSPAYLLAHHLINEPTAGRIMTVVFRDDQFIPIQGYYGSTWRSDPAKAGNGALLEHSIHDIDMFHYLCGPITRLNAHTANFHGHEHIEDVASATLRFASGATATLTSVWHDNLSRPSLRRVEVFCERRHIVIDGDDWYGPVSWSDADGTTGELQGDELIEATATMIDGPANPDVAFVEAALAGRMAWPDFDTAVEAHRVVDAIYRSAAAGGAPIDLAAPPQIASDAAPVPAASGTPMAGSPTARRHEPIVVRPIATADTHDLRRRVLRKGTPSTDVTYPQDDLATTEHLGAFAGDRLLGVSTWAFEAYPGADDRPAMRLRGMAVEEDQQGNGIGQRLVEAGVDRYRSAARLLWAHARDPVIAFYERLGFRVVGEGFIDAATAIPHHVVVRDLAVPQEAPR